MTEAGAHHLRRIARGGTLSIAGAGVSAVAGFVVVAMITNQYSKPDAGVIFSATSLFLVFVALGGLGIEVGLGRFVPGLLMAGRWDAIERCLKNTLLVTTLTSVMIGLAAWIWAEPLAAAMALPAGSGGSVLKIMAVAIPPTTVGLWALGASRAFANIRQTVWFDKLFRSLAQLALVAWASAAATGLVGLSLAWVIPSVLLAPLGLWGLLTLLRKQAVHGQTDAFANRVVVEFWSFTWPRSIAQVAQVIIQRADIILVGAIISPAAAAVYTAATRFVPLGQLGVQAVQQVIQPRFAHLVASNDRESLRHVFQTTTAWNMAMAWPLYLIIAGVPNLYLSLFGPGFTEQGREVVLVMAAAMLLGVASGPVDTLLLMSGRSGLSLANSLIALVIDLGLCLLLIPVMSITGAAVAWCVAVAVRSGLGYVQVRSQLGLSPLSRLALVVAVAAVVSFGLPLGLVGALADGAPLVGLAVMVLGAVLYAAILWRFRRLLQLSALGALLPARLRRAADASAGDDASG